MDNVVAATGDWIPTPVLLASIAALIGALFALLRWAFGQIMLKLERMESNVNAMSKSIDKELNEIKLAQTKFVTFDDLSRTINSLHEKTNNIRERMAVMEARSGK